MALHLKERELTMEIAQKVMEASIAGQYANCAVKATRALEDRISEAAAIRGQINGAVSYAQEILNRLSGDHGHAENEGAECCDKPAGSIAQLSDIQNDCQRGLKRLHAVMEQIGHIV
jgi:hypothetical protein